MERFMIGQFGRFDHKSELISDEELDSCYNWVDKLLST